MQIIVRRKLLWAMVASLISSPAWALDGKAADIEPILELSLEQLMSIEVTSASKYAQKSSEAPSAVAVLTADDIRTFGYRTLGEALNGLPGLYTSSDRNYNYLGVRGALRPNDYNSRILIMVDGRRMNDNIYDQASPGQEFLLDMELVERIEYIPGPGSSIYGANAFLGVINVITKQGKDINGTQLAGEVGTFDARKTRVTFGKKLENGADVLLSASRLKTDGDERLYFPEFDDPSSNNGIASHMDKEISRRYFAKISFDTLTFTAGYVNRFKRVPTASFGAIFNDPSYHTTDMTGYADLKYEKALNDKTSIELRGFYQAYDYKGKQPYDDGLGNRVINYDNSLGRWWGGEAKLVTTAFNRQKIVVGLEYQYDQQQKLETYDLDPFFLYQKQNRSGSRVGVFVQDDVQLTGNMILSAGLRVDQHHMLDRVQWNPRLGLIWSPQQTTTVKLLYGSAFRAPNVYERDYAAIGSVANPGNQEEHVKTYQGIVEWQPGNGVRLMGSLFRNEMKDILELRADVAGSQFENTGKLRATGLELQAEKRWNTGSKLKVSYSHTHLTDERTGEWATASPKNMLKLQYGRPLFGNAAKLGIESVYISKRKTVQGNMADGYNLVNLNLSSKKLLPGLEATLGVYNLFDAHPQIVGGEGAADLVQDVIKMDGRNLRLKLEYQF